MRYYVSKVVDAATGQGHVLGLARIDDAGNAQLYRVGDATWTPAPQSVLDDLQNVTAPLNDDAHWQPIPDDAVPGVQGSLHRAPEPMDPELTEVAARRNIVHYVTEILKLLPDGLVAGFQEPGHAPGSCGSGPVGPGGWWNFEARYRVWGFPRGSGSDAVFDSLKRLFDAWGWTYRYEDHGGRHVAGWTDTNRKHAYHVEVSRYPHGGVTMRWTSPDYPAEYGDASLHMPSVITNDGIQSWRPPVFTDSVREDGTVRVIPGGFSEVIHYYDLWRRIAERVGQDRYAEAEWEKNRLWFRTVDQQQDWAGGWIVEPTLDGLYYLIRAQLSEGPGTRQESVIAGFSRLADAGKQLIIEMGTSLRWKVGLAPVLARWDTAGQDPRIETLPADAAAIDSLVAIQPGINRQIAGQHLKIYRLRTEPGSYAVAFSDREPYMRLLALSYQELNETLMDGLPPSLTGLVPR